MPCTYRPTEQYLVATAQTSLDEKYRMVNRKCMCYLTLKYAKLFPAIHISGILSLWSRGSGIVIICIDPDLPSISGNFLKKPWFQQLSDFQQLASFKKSANVKNLLYFIEIYNKLLFWIHDILVRKVIKNKAAEVKVFSSFSCILIEGAGSDPYR
jgi:hypothetical protein